MTDSVVSETITFEFVNPGIGNGEFLNRHAALVKNLSTNLDASAYDLKTWRFKTCCCGGMFYSLTVSKEHADFAKSIADEFATSSHFEKGPLVDNITLLAEGESAENEIF
jgi:hypothetical protein